MKQCPECREKFDDDQRFCELHGVPLVDDAAAIRDALRLPYKPTRDVAGVAGTVSIGVLVGIVLSLLAYILFVSPSINDKAAEKRAGTPQMANSRPNQLATTATPRESEVSTPVTSPTEEMAVNSPSPSPVASVSSDAPPAAAMNDGPISTGTKRGSENGQALIKMKDGTSVEADAAWEDSQGVWYRRGNMVAFVERTRVDKIMGVQKRPISAEESRH